MKRKIAIAIIALLSLTSLVGCRKVDIDITGAELVPGTRNLYRFCDRTTLIYVEKVSGSDDEYVALFSWGCTADGRLTEELPGTLGDGNGGDTGSK